MALTYTPSADTKFSLPAFSLPTVNGKIFSSADLSLQKPTCVMFICNHCPYVKAVEDRLITLAKDFADSVHFIAICSNDPTDYPEDSAENLLKRSSDKAYPFPYLIDSSQEVAKSFGAVCTPDLFLFDHQQKLYYRGRLDDSWRDPSKVQKEELKEAIENVLSNLPPPEQMPSMGCSIKWRV